MKRKILRKTRIVTILSALVVFLTVYSLVLPAVALTDDKAGEDPGINTSETTNVAEVEKLSLNEETSSDVEIETTEQAEKEIQEEEIKEEKTVIENVSYPAVSFSDSLGDMIVYVEAPEGAFPENTQMQLKEVEDETALVDSINSNLENKEVKAIKAVDITFIYNNEEFEPLKPIKVSMTSSFIESNKEDEQLLVHVDNDNNTNIVETTEVKEKDAEVINNVEEVQALVENTDEINEITTDNTVAFESDAFSVYAVIYTVDFEYEGYTYTINGGTSLLLSELFDSLGIKDDLKDIKTIEFSNPSLIKVSKNGNDWKLSSIKPFNTEEELIIVLYDGYRFAIKVTDDNTYSSNLADFLSSVTINAEEEDGKYKIKPGKTYSAHLSFKENADGFQFDESGHLTYSFPDGFTPLPVDGTFTIVAKSKGVEYPVEGNTYKVENGQLIIDLNTSDPNYQYVQSSAIATIDLNFDGTFDLNKNSIDWTDEIKTEIEPDLDKGVTIDKSISNFDPATGKITYQLKIKSLNGENTNIVVSDHMDGTAVAINEDVSLIDASMSSDGITYTRLGYGDNIINGFSFTIPSMSAGAEATVTYTATINKDKLIGSGINLDHEGKNGVTATPDKPGKPDSSYVDLKNTISTPILSKGSTVSDVVNDKRIVTWTIVATSDDYFSLAGGNIIDIIQESSRSDMKYFGEGLTIVVTDSNGSETRDVSWADVGVTNLQSAYSWTYHVPSTDTGEKKYTITYKTEVDVSDYTGDVTLNNNVNDGIKTTGGGAVVGPDGDDKKADIDKKVGPVSLESIDWTVDITVPVQGLTRAKLIDDLPTQGEGTYHDTLHGSTNDVIVSGLDENRERAVKTYENYQLIINFQRLVDGEWTDGLYGAENPRTIKVSFSTDNDKNWIAAAEQATYLREHVNKASFEANRLVLTDEASGTPMKMSFEKKKTPDTPSPGSVTVDGVIYPVYYYTITMSGINGPFDITDEFDSRFIPIESSLYSEQAVVYGGGQYHQGYAGKSPAVIETTDEGSMIIHVSEENLAKDEGGSYYSHYRIVYALRVKDADSLRSLKAEAAATEGGILTLRNTAISELGQGHVDVKYEYNSLTKELLNGAELGPSTNIGKFRIIVNPEGHDLDHESDIVTLTDTFSNTLSIDYDSIKVEPSEGVTWYVSQNTATFTLPDETPLVITYDAKVIGNGNIHFDNTAQINGQKATISETKNVNSGASGSAGNYSMMILKHKRYDFTEVLSGAKFGLFYDDNKQPVTANGENVVFVTDKDGKAYIEGNQATDGWALKADKMYYVQELEAPKGYKLSTTQYKFQIASDNVPDYTNNIYFNGDILHINNTPLGGLEIKKSVYGTELDDAQKNAITFTVTKPDGTTVSKKLSEFTDGKWKLTDLPVGTYTVAESGADIEGYDRTTSYSVGGTSTTEGETASVEITDPTAEKSVSFINKYKSNVIIEPDTLQLKVQKKWFVGDEDKSFDDAFANRTATINLKRYKAEIPLTTLHFRGEDGSATSILIDDVSVPKGLNVTLGLDNQVNTRAMKAEGSMWNNNIAIAPASHTKTYSFNTGDYLDIYVNFQGHPGTVKVSYTGGSEISDNSFVVDESYSGQTANIIGGGSKTFNNLPLTGEVDDKSYVYRYYIEETAIDGFTTSYQVGSDDFKDSISAADALGTEGNGNIVVKNTQEAPATGALIITKIVHVDDVNPETDAEKDLVNGNYVFTVAKDNSIIKYVQITVTNGEPSSYKVADTEEALKSAASQTGTSALISDLAEGNYVITEIEKNGMTLKEAARGDGNTGAVSSEKAVTVHVTAGQNEPADTSAAAATFTNNIETVTAKVVKVWNHSGNTGTTPTSLTVTLSNGETKELNGDNNWTAEVTDLPKYDRTTGNLIEYSWTEAELPAGYYLSNIQETTDTATGVITTTLTNSYTDHYNPTTTITGKKVWDDGGEGRPDSITVNLYKDGGSTPYRTITVQASTGEGANQDEWPFEFTNLPVFNSDGSVIQYTVEEVLPEGYTNEYGTKIVFSQATYTAGDTTATVINSYNEFTMIACDGVDLGYIVIRHGQTYTIWTPRPLQSGEWDKIKEAIAGAQPVTGTNQFSGLNDPHSLDFITGVPATFAKNKISVSMKNGQVEVHFFKPSGQSDLAYGKIPYTYTQAGGEGGGTITNTKKKTDIEFGKQWIDISQQEIEWDQDIQVTVSRNKGDGTKDAAFSLVYNIVKTSVNGATGGTAEFSTGTETDPKLKLTITTESGTKKYSFMIENLAYSSETDGKYTYYVEETNSQLTGYLAPSYTNTSAPTGATAAYDGGTIINKQEGGSELPHTGGPGDTMIKLLGTVIMFVAIASFLERKKRK